MFSLWKKKREQKWGDGTKSRFKRHIYTLFKNMRYTCENVSTHVCMLCMLLLTYKLKTKQ